MTPTTPIGTATRPVTTTVWRGARWQPTLVSAPSSQPSFRLAQHTLMECSAWEVLTIGFSPLAQGSHQVFSSTSLLVPPPRAASTKLCSTGFLHLANAIHCCQHFSCAPSASTALPTPTPICGPSASTPASRRTHGPSPTVPRLPWGMSAPHGRRRPRCVGLSTGVRPSSRSTPSWLSCLASPPTSCAPCTAPSSQSCTATTMTSTSTTPTGASSRTRCSRCGGKKARPSPRPSALPPPTATTYPSTPMTANSICTSPTLSSSVDWRPEEPIHE